MGKIIVTELATLDGIFEDPAGIEGFELGGWALEVDQGEEGRRIKVDEIFDAEALLFGRVTYESQLHAWEQRADKDMGLSAHAMSLPKFVVSSTMEDSDDPTVTVLRGHVTRQVEMLKDMLPGTILVPGSSQLMRVLFEEALLDEMRVMVYPVLLGAGKPLFPPETARRPMRLAHGDTLGAGIAYFVFVPRDPTPEEAMELYE